MKEKVNNVEKNGVKSSKEEPHIIRRQVKIVNSDETVKENKADKKLVNLDPKSEVRNTQRSSNNYGYQHNNKSNNNKFLNNRNANVVIMKNGKKVEKEVAKEVTKEPVEQIKRVENTQEVKKEVVNKEVKNTNTENKNPQGNSERKPYNRDNQNGGERRPYSRDNQNGGERRPYNRDNRNGGFERKPYNRDNQNSSTYQVSKFIKNNETTIMPQKETKEYSQTLINKDKERFNSDNKTQDKRTEKINKNVMREQNTRIDIGKLKGLEVDSDRGMLDLYDRGMVRNRKSKTKKPKMQLKQTLIVPMTEVKIPESLTVKAFAELIKKTSSEVIKKLFGLGIMATLNQEIDFDTAFLIAEEYGITAEKEIVKTEEDILFDDTEDSEEELKPRPPIVVVMGHVDHGKTSILDYIRKSDVQSVEAGGITQHIGAYKVKVQNKEITFLDTPGHEAFTEMRARGAQVTDIAIIVVAADDGIMPQTVEAINHAKAAEVSIMVAINKIDKPGANVDRVKQELLENGLVPEEWGGDTICVPVSALTGEGMQDLLETVLLVAEVKDLKANPKKQSKGTVIEARLDKAKGTVATLLVQRGELNIGDTIVCGEVIGRIRAMTDHQGKKVKLAGPSTPVEVMGLSGVPQTGDVFYEVKDEKTAKQLIEKRKAKTRRSLIKEASKVTLDDLFSQIKEGEIKDLNIIVKADVQGSVEAVKDSLQKLSNEEVRVRVIHGAAGAISESDVTLASVSNAIIIGFNVRPNPVAEAIAKKEKVDLRIYRVIYDAIQDVETAMTGMLAPTFKEVVHGTAEVRNVFTISNVGQICGCYVKSGKVIRNGLIRVIRDNIVIAEDKIDSLKRMKDDAKEVAENYECGIKLEKFNEIKELDILECFELVEEEKKLKSKKTK